MRSILGLLSAAALVAAAVFTAVPAGASAGSFQQCVIAHESSGNAQARNPYSGAWGLYGFMAATYAAFGGRGFGYAGAAEQTAVFWRAYRALGTAPWRGDGCA